MSFQLGVDTYTGGTARVLYWKHLDASQSVVRVGNFSSIANDVRFFVDGNHRIDHASTFPFWETGVRTGVPNGWGKGAPRVGHDVWIAEGASIMSGVAIADGAVVCAGSLVSRDVPPYAVVAGNPAVLKRYRFDPPTVERLLRARWWDLPRDVVRRELVPLQGDVARWLERAEALRDTQDTARA